MRMSLSLGLPGGAARAAANPLAAYGPDGFSPELVADFAGQLYAYDGTVRSGFSDLITSTRASDATYFDSAGLLKTAASGVARSAAYRYNGTSWVRRGLIEPTGVTNLCAWSRDLSETGWSAVNSATQAQNETGLDGVSNTAWTLTDANGSGIGQWAYEATVPNDGNDVVGAPYFKKTTGASNRVGLQVAFSNGGTTVFYAAALNTNDGTVTPRAAGGSVSAPTWAEVEDCGDWWRLSVAGPNNSTGNTKCTIYLAPAVATSDTGTWDASATGSCVVDQVDLVANQIVPTSPIITAGSTAARAAETWEIAGAKTPANTTAQWYHFEGEATYADENLGGQINFLRHELDGNSYANMFMRTSGSDTGKIIFIQKETTNIDSVEEASPGSYSPGIAVPVSIASRNTDGAINGAVDGGALTANTTPTALADLSAAAIEIVSVSSGPVYISRIVMGSGDPLDAGIEEVTS